MDQAASTLVINPFVQGASPAGTNQMISPNDNGTSSLLQSIRQQMEFYFGDQNFPNDVFLNKLLQLDETGQGWVPLQVVANFNKVKQLTSQLDIVRQALRYSPLIEVSEDGLYIRRKTPIMVKQTNWENQKSFKSEMSSTEKRTIYVSKVPKNTDKESLHLLFKEFGTIVRLDLPMDKKTGENRGIAFVEYKSETEMLNAMQHFASDKHKMVLKPFKAKAEVPKDTVKHEEPNNQKETKGNKETKESKGETADARPNEAKLKVGKQEKKEKQKKKDNGEQKDKEVIGREVPVTPDSVYDGKEAWSGRVRTNSKGARLQTEWDPNPSNASQRPKLHLKGQTESGKPQFVPIRNPLGPDLDGGRGFSAGRGKVAK